MEEFLATVLARRADTRGIRGGYPQIFYVSSQILLCSEKFVLNIR